MEKQYEYLRGLLAQHGYPTLKDMVDIAEKSLGVDQQKITAAIEQAKEMAAKEGHDIGIVFASPDVKDTFAFLNLTTRGLVEIASRWALFMLVTPEGELREGPAAQAIPVMPK